MTTTFDPARAEKFIASLQRKPASRLVLNITIEHKWMLEIKEEIMTDLLQRLEIYPPGRYVVGVIANRVMDDWQFVSVGFKQVHNLMTSFPFYIGEVVKK